MFNPHWYQQDWITNLVATNGLEKLKAFLGLEPSTSVSSDNFQDVVFVAIDFERTRNLVKDSPLNLNVQVGAAIFDTRSLASSDLSPATQIPTYTLVSGNVCYYRSAVRKCPFGETIMVHKQETPQILESLIPRDRSIVLVGHGFKFDLQTLKFIDFDLETSVVGVLDTFTITKEGDGRHWASKKLSGILTELGCPFHELMLHNGGNDAHFTIRALLLFAVQSYETSGAIVNDYTKERLSLIRAIAKAPLPEWMTESEWAFKQHQEVMKRRLEKSQRREEALANFLDEEAHDRIRAEKAAKRLENEMALEDETALGLAGLSLILEQ